MTLCPKQNVIRDKKYRDSFKIYSEHRCLITGAEFTEFSSESIDGAHITIGRYGRGIKPPDNLILPLCHFLHMEFDKNQTRFIDDNFRLFPINLIHQAEVALNYLCGNLNMTLTEYNIAIVKEIARQYYKKWKEK